jgi:uncharacterized membrane protein
MKKFAYLIILFAYVMGIIGGIGYTCYIHEWVIAIAVAVVGVMAFPAAKNIYKKMMDR